MPAPLPLERGAVWILSLRRVRVFGLYAERPPVAGPGAFSFLLGPLRHRLPARLGLRGLLCRLAFHLA